MTLEELKELNETDIRLMKEIEPKLEEVNSRLLERCQQMQKMDENKTIFERAKKLELTALGAAHYSEESFHTAYRKLLKVQEGLKYIIIHY